MLRDLLSITSKMFEKIITDQNKMKNLTKLNHRIPSYGDSCPWDLQMMKHEYCRPNTDELERSSFVAASLPQDSLCCSAY